jgi:hypothetical protein
MLWWFGFDVFWGDFVVIVRRQLCFFWWLRGDFEERWVGFDFLWGSGEVRRFWGSEMMSRLFWSGGGVVVRWYYDGDEVGKVVLRSWVGGEFFWGGCDVIMRWWFCRFEVVVRLFWGSGEVLLWFSWGDFEVGGDVVSRCGEVLLRRWWTDFEVVVRCCGGSKWFWFSVFVGFEMVRFLRRWVDFEVFLRWWDCGELLLSWWYVGFEVWCGGFDEVGRLFWGDFEMVMKWFRGGVDVLVMWFEDGDEVVL